MPSGVYKRPYDAENELKLRVDLRKEGEICQAECIKGPMTASRDLNGQ